MNVILYMAITVNGFIATEHDDVSWVTETEWASFSGMIKKHGNMIIGRRTYDIMVENDEFERSQLTKIHTVVVTDDVSLKAHNPEFIVTAKSPREALTILSNKGFETIMVCGGGGLNTSFMKENLIDELYLDVEPLVFDKGIRLFKEDGFEATLKLLETRKLSTNEIQLHYQVVK